MRLAFDLDGTLADMQGALALVARDLFPGIDPATLPRSTAAVDGPAREAGDAPPSQESQFSTQSLTPRQQRDLWKAACGTVNFWESLREIEPGVLARLYRMMQERRWEVIFLTSRPETEGDTAQAQSHRWLAAHGFPTPSVFVVHGSRGKIAAALALDVLVDDRPENCLDVAIDSSARAILIWRGEEEDKVLGSARQLGIGAVGSIHQCLDILEAVDAPSPDEVGVVERFKRLLGLKPRVAKRRDAGRPDALVPVTLPPGTALSNGK
jgi:hypothetical protein